MRGSGTECPVVYLSNTCDLLNFRSISALCYRENTGKSYFELDAKQGVRKFLLLLYLPTPFVLQTALTDFAVTYEINACCKDATRMAALYTELHRNIQDVFNEYGVQTMTPNYVADTPDPKLVPAGQWYTPPGQ